MPYSFQSFVRDITVDIPELDAFLSDLKGVCERYGVALVVDPPDYEDGDAHLVLAPFKESKDELIHIYGTKDGIPFMDRAKSEWFAKKSDFDANERRLKEEKKDAIRDAHEDHIKRFGIALSDGVYQLLKK